MLHYVTRPTDGRLWLLNPEAVTSKLTSRACAALLHVEIGDTIIVPDEFRSDMQCCYAPLKTRPQFRKNWILAYSLQAQTTNRWWVGTRSEEGLICAGSFAALPTDKWLDTMTWRFVR